MINQLFVNLPVKDLQQSLTFFKALGFTFNAQFTDDKAACLVLSETNYAMLLLEDYFKTFITKPISDAKANTEVLVACMVNSRIEVDRILEAALHQGAYEYRPVADLGFMYQRSFEDLDGHQWEFAWMDPSYVQ